MAAWATWKRLPSDGSGNIINQDYYRYYKLSGDAYDAQVTGNVPPPSATNNPSTTGGPSPLQPGYANSNNPYMDNYIFSGLKTVVQGASVDRIAAAVPSFQTTADSG